MTQNHTPTPMQRAAKTFRRFVIAHFPIPNANFHAAMEECRLVDRACNSHAALVEALESNLRALEGRIKPPHKTVKEWAESAIDSSDAKIKSEAKAILQMIAALALAKGE